MNKKVFQDKVLPEIEGRMSSKLKPQAVDDWFYFVSKYAPEDAIAQIKEFFRTWNGKFAPKPNEFNTWRRQEARDNPQRTGGNHARFDVPALKMPRMSIIRVVSSEFRGEDWRIGYIVRHDYTSDAAFIFERIGKDKPKWNTQSFMPVDVWRWGMQIKILDGVAPESWLYFNPGPDAPEELENILEGWPMDIFEAPF